MLETIKASGESLMEIINDVLSFSRIESGKLEMEHLPFDLHKIIEDSMDLLALSAKNRGLYLRCKIDESVPEKIIGDAGMLRQVLINLIGNAIKFTESGTIEVSAMANLLGPDDYQIQLSVKDTGIGISSSQLEKLFLPFTQVDMSITRKYGGTGLGLAVSRQLVSLMGGNIWVVSQPGEGSTFNFTIRSCSSTACRLEEGNEALPQILSAPFSNRNLRILVAEDNPSNQKVALRMLSKLGYRADAVANGIEVLQSMERQHYDIILMDIQMPEMNGIDAARIIRQRYPDRPYIIAVTAFALEGDREKHLAAGMDDYIAKPFEKDDLKRAIEHFIVSAS